MRNHLKIFSAVILGVALISGCATIPVKEQLTQYSLNGATYYSLAQLCQVKGVAFSYDTYLRTAFLAKGGHEISVMAGDNLILVDRRAMILSKPVDIYEGALVVPEQFKAQVLDALFKPGKVNVQRRKTAISSVYKKIVVDAGHGGHDPGAIGKSGLREKDVNLDIARRLSGLLKDEGVEVVMTRSSDKYIPLGTRVSIANNSRADLFVSIHSNANRVRSVNGFEVYYVSTSVSDSGRAYSAAKGAYLNLSSSCFYGSSQDLKAILWDMLYNYNRGQSISLAHNICRSADDNLDARIIGVKDARFAVLRGARMPAILIEVGFLSNQKEEALLRDSSYREELARSIMKGFADFSAHKNNGGKQ
jgi:N-acetylmuramoyl-L-alanine amidase